MNKVLFFIISFFCVFTLNAQDTLIYIDGKIKTGKVHFTEGADELVLFRHKGNQAYVKARKVNVDDVFSVKYESGKTRVFYKYDEQNANLLKLADMQKFVAGEQYAWKYFHARVPFLFGSVVGFTGPRLLGFYGLSAIPLSYFLVNIVPVGNPKFKEGANINENLLESETFIDGYKEIAKRKKQRNALWGSIVGSAVFYTYFNIIR